MANWGLVEMLDAIEGSADRAYHSQEGVDQLSNVCLSSPAGFLGLAGCLCFLAATRPV
jgi:hypothetical protein